MNEPFIPDADGLLWVRITRQPKGAPSGDGGIDRALWRRVVAADPAFSPIDHVIGIDPQTHEPMFVPVRDAATWTEHPEGVQYVFHLRSGEIVIESADRHVAAKAQSLAIQLSAFVVITVD